VKGSGVAVCHIPISLPFVPGCRFPRQCSAILLGDGIEWLEVHHTDSSVLCSNHIALGSGSSCTKCIAAAAFAPLPMLGYYSVRAVGNFHGQDVHGILKLNVQAPHLQSIAEDRAAAAKSTDARDGCFAT